MKHIRLIQVALAAAFVAGPVAPLAAQPLPAISAASATAPTLPFSALYVAEFEVVNADAIKSYTGALESSFRPFGGRYLVQSGKAVPLEGAATKTLLIIQFPSVAQAQGWYNSPAYRALKAIRQNGANSRVYIVEGVGN